MEVDEERKRVRSEHTHTRRQIHICIHMYHDKVSPCVVQVSGRGNIWIVISYAGATRVRALNLFGTPGWDVPDL